MMENRQHENMELVFKKPLNRPLKKKKKILSEETYIKSLQNIIERDFFPSLKDLRKSASFNKADEENDFIKMKELYEKYQDIANSPVTFDTPSGVHNQINKESTFIGEINNADCNNVITEKLSLDDFMNKYTSEDNKSFEDLMEKAEAKFKLKHSWLFDAEKKHNSLFTPNMALPSAKEQHRSKLLAIQGTEESQDSRPKSLENWTFKTYNSVMYTPDGVKSSASQNTKLARAKEKQVIYENTRFEENPFKEEINQTAMMEASAFKAIKKEGKVGIDGKELVQSPRVNGYNFLRSPSPAIGPKDSPFMTWGEIEGTPCQLEGSQTPLMRRAETPGPSYKIPKASFREELLIQLNEKVSETKKMKRQSKSPFHKSRRNLISPAAQKLLKSDLNKKGLGASLRAAYTPSPNSARSPLFPSSPALSKNTPMIKSLSVTDNILHLPSKNKALVQTPKSSVTDNLLNLPSKINKSEGKNISNTPVRMSASDFF